MNYFLETEVKPIQVDNGLSLHQRYQSMRYRAIRFPGSEQASVRPAALDTRFGNAPNVASPLAGASLGQASARLATPNSLWPAARSPTGSTRSRPT